MEGIAESSGKFVFTQKGKHALDLEGQIYYMTSCYTNKIENKTTIYWQCERQRDLGCKVNVSTDVRGHITNGPTGSHIHEKNVGRSETLMTRYQLLFDAERRPEASPGALLNDHVTPDVALKLGNELSLKKAIQRRRQHKHPKDPQSASELVITDDWAVTLDGKNWYIGQVQEGAERVYIFATEENLRNLQVCCLHTCIV